MTQYLSIALDIKPSQLMAALALLFCLFVAGGCLPLYMDSAIEQLRPPPEPPLIRVRIAADTDVFRLRPEKRVTLLGSKPDGERVVYSVSGGITIRHRDGSFHVLDREQITLASGLSGVWIQPADQATKTQLDGIPYYGDLIFGRGPKKTVEVINRLNLDRYLMGVLTPELGERSPDEFEAVKAQAVASRTYALAHLGQYTNAHYDLSADESDQIYVGNSQQRDWVDRAVEATRGEVITYDGHLIEAYYHSTCGGKTDAIEEIWGKGAKPYLVSIDDDTICNWSKYWQWTETFDSAVLVSNLRSFLDVERGESFQISDVHFADTTAGGRKRVMTVVTPRRTWTIKDDKIRWALGRPSRPAGILPSSRFSMELIRRPDGRVIGAVVEGRGYGHGIGMCQCGMIGRARAGQSYADILEFYYPGAQVQRCY